MYKFCPQCGKALKQIVENNHRRLQCIACGFIFYQNSKPTSSAIITDGTRILLDDLGAIQWFAKDEIPKNLAFKSSRDMINAWLAAE
jgi:hypothetical protein